jgi:uncharacterized small protein (DUF1192 family)
VATACDKGKPSGYFPSWQGRRQIKTERMMPAIDDDDRPKKKLVHEIGQDLALLSIEELGDRISLLREEITRLEADIARKRATKSAADTFFKR